jgi:cytochrome P450
VDPDSISKEELGEIGGMILVASVDTTSSVLSWCIVHLTMNPSVQEFLYVEISKNLSTLESGRSSEAMKFRRLFGRMSDPSDTNQVEI